MVESHQSIGALREKANKIRAKLEELLAAFNPYVREVDEALMRIEKEEYEAKLGTSSEIRPWIPGTRAKKSKRAS